MLTARQKDWKKILKADPTEWLLKGAKPLGRYYILREIVGRPEKDAEVGGLRKEILEETLGKQMKNGSWNDKVHDYAQGTTQQMMCLIDLGLTRKDEPIGKGAEYIFKHQSKNGSFIQEPPDCGIEAGLVVTNSAVLALARAGYGDDARVARAYEWLCGWQQKDGSWLSPRAKKSREKGEGYPDTCCGIHATCNVLLGLSASEKTRQSEAAKRGKNCLLDLYGQKYDVGEKIEPLYFMHMQGKKQEPFEGAWSDPRAVPPDVGTVSEREIEILTTGHVLSTLSMLGCGLDNEKVRRGLERLISLQGEDGRWVIPSSNDWTHLFTRDSLMTMKSLHQSLCSFSFHGH